MIEVQVRVKLRGEVAWAELDVAPEEYFWRSDDLPWSIDSEPGHLHPSRLVPGRPVELAIVRVTDTATGSFHEGAYHYWNGPEDYACVVTWNREGKVTRELIFVGRMPYRENGSQVIRVNLDGEVPTTTMNCFMWGRGGDEHSESMLLGDRAA